MRDKSLILSLILMVRDAGIGPATSSMSTTRSTIEPIALKSNGILILNYEPEFLSMTL